MILPQIATKEYYTIFMQQLDMLLLDLYGYSMSELQERLTSAYDYKFAHIISAHLASNNLVLTSDTVSAVDACLRELKESLLAVNTLELYIAFHPTELFLRKLNSWVALNLPSHTLLDLKIDSRIIAGAKIYFNGRTLDASFATGLLKARKDLR